METVRYPVSPDSEAGVSDERVDSVVNSQSGQYSLTCVRSDKTQTHILLLLLLLLLPLLLLQLLLID